MSKFTLKRNKNADGSILLCNLVIDGVYQFKKFKDELEANYESGFRSLCSYINLYSNKRRLCNGWRRKLERTGYKAFEFRTTGGNALRVYVVKLKDNPNLICICGYKRNQDADLIKLDSIVKRLKAHIKQEGEFKIPEKDEKEK